MKRYRSRFSAVRVSPSSTTVVGPDRLVMDAMGVSRGDGASTTEASPGAPAPAPAKSPPEASMVPAFSRQQKCDEGWVPHHPRAPVRWVHPPPHRVKLGLGKNSERDVVAFSP